MLLSASALSKDHSQEEAYHGALLDYQIKALTLKRQVKHIRHDHLYSCSMQRTTTIHHKIVLRTVSDQASVNPIPFYQHGATGCLSKFETQLKFTVGALGRQAVAHPVHGDRREVDAGDASGDALSKQVLPEARVAAADLQDLRASANEAGAPSLPNAQQRLGEEPEKEGKARTEMEGQRSGARRWRKWEKSFNHS
jgi:hypothetical protein